MTYKGSVQLNDLDEAKARKVLLNSAARGHASLTTSVVFSFFLFNTSKLIDSAFTGSRFGSFLMPSGRRTGVSKEAILVPKELDKKLAKEYELIIADQIDFYSTLLEAGVKKDEASKILSYGTLGGGFFTIPLETFLIWEKTYKANKEWVPSEIFESMELIRAQLKKSGTSFIYECGKNAKRTSYIFPTIFKNPFEKTQFDALTKYEEKLFNSSTETLLIQKWINKEIFKGLEEKLEELNKWKSDLIFLISNSNLHKKSDQIANEIEKLLYEVSKISSEYSGAISLTFLSKVAWRVWGEVKRHRTLQQEVESIYRAVTRTLLNKDNLDNFISIPKGIKERGFDEKWKEIILRSLDFYEKVKIKYGKYNPGYGSWLGLYVVPRAIKLLVLKKFDLYNLIAGYMPLRLCSTAEEEMQRITNQELKIITKKIPELAKFIKPKCWLSCFCPEKNYCSAITELFPGYKVEIHEALNENLVMRQVLSHTRLYLSLIHI